MDFTRLLMLTVALSVTSCSSHSGASHETKECMQYRSMMTAPMPQAAVDNLKAKCEQSRE